MPKYYFVKEVDKDNKFDNSSVTFQVDTDNLDELVQEFNYFLKGCGFHPRGPIEVVEEIDSDE
jgi:hypothetical protein